MTAPCRENRILRAIVGVALYCLVTFPVPANAWNSPAHMISGSIAYQILQREHPATINSVTAVLKQHPWYAAYWNRQVDPEQMDLLFHPTATVRKWLAILKQHNYVETRNTGRCLEIVIKKWKSISQFSNSAVRVIRRGQTDYSD
jgi:hypothetical protein